MDHLHELNADPVGVRRWDRLAQFVAIHPVNSHGSSTFDGVPREAINARGILALPMSPSVAINAHRPPDMIASKRHEEVPAALEFTMAAELMIDTVTVSPQPEHRST